MEIKTLLDRLADPDGEVGWQAQLALLELGEPAFDPLVGVLSTADDDVAERAYWVLSKLENTPLGRYAAALGHPHPKVRLLATQVFQFTKDDALPHAEALVPVLGDVDTEVRQRVIWAFANIGNGVIPLLRRVRRTHASPKIRRAALIALAETGGADALDEVDHALIARLIRIKLTEEEPEGIHLCGGWFALPTTDQAAVLKAFDLSDPVTVTMRLGASAWNHDHHAYNDFEHTRCSRVYVSPAIDGWTMVFGHPFEHDDRSEVDLCRELSREFGEAHWYAMSCGDGWTAWCVAECGEVIRYYDAFESGKQIGELDAEEGYALPHEDPDDSDLDDCYATDIAERLSVNPADPDFFDELEGHSVLALTACGRAYGSPPGALTF